MKIVLFVNIIKQFVSVCVKTVCVSVCLSLTISTPHLHQVHM